MHLFKYVNNIEELMSVADIVVTKPGGLTVTESLVKKLPMIIVNPLPGQEAKNTRFLINNNAAVKANDARDVARRIGDLVGNPNTIRQIQNSITRISRPKAAFEIAERILNWEDI